MFIFMTYHISLDPLMDVFSVTISTHQYDLETKTIGAPIDSKEYIFSRYTHFKSFVEKTFELLGSGKVGMSEVREMLSPLADIVKPYYLEELRDLASYAVKIRQVVGEA